MLPSRVAIVVAVILAYCALSLSILLWGLWATQVWEQWLALGTWVGGTVLGAWWVTRAPT